MMLHKEQHAARLTDRVLLPFQPLLTFELYERIWAAVYGLVLEQLA